MRMTRIRTHTKKSTTISVVRSWLFMEDHISQRSNKSHLLSGGAGEDTTLNTVCILGERA